MSNEFVFDIDPKKAEELLNDLNTFPQSFDTFIKSDVPPFRPVQGVNKIRLLPPISWKATWPDKEFDGILGLKVYTHIYLTPAGDYYLCNRVMQGSDCPFCEVFDKYRRSSWETARPYSPKPRVLLWLYDFNEESPGVKLWIAPTSIIAEILEAAYDDEAGRYLPLFDMENGHLIRFKMKKENNMNKYLGVKILSPKPLEKTILSQIRPYEDILVFYSYDHMKKRLDLAFDTVNEVEEEKVFDVPEEPSVNDLEDEVSGVVEDDIPEDVPF